MTTIKKTEQYTTYKAITQIHMFTINGKEVEIYHYNKEDNINQDYESDTNIRNIENLTEQEQEYIGENMQELLDLKINESYHIGEL